MERGRNTFLFSSTDETDPKGDGVDHALEIVTAARTFLKSGGGRGSVSPGFPTSLVTPLTAFSKSAKLPTWLVELFVMLTESALLPPVASAIACMRIVRKWGAPMLATRSSRWWRRRLSGVVQRPATVDPIDFWRRWADSRHWPCSDWDCHRPRPADL